MEYNPNVCIIEDDPIMGESLLQRLNMEGFRVNLYDRAHKAYEKLIDSQFDIILCDIRLPDMNGIDLYHKLLDDNYRIPPTIFMTAHGTIEHAVELLKLGATDYVTKPFSPDMLINKLKSITINPKNPLKNRHEVKLGVSPAIIAIQKHLDNLSEYYETPLLISGETGVGKEVIARYLHQHQSHDGPFVAINCSAIPESLIESELFGHEKGAFTGATRTHKGVFEQAFNGTLLLDEIAELPIYMQAKLLRVLQECSIKRVGGEKEIAISTRLIFATNKDLEKLVSNGQFREDLFYRINVVHTTIPPLRERKEDILWLAERFIKEHQSNHQDVKFTLHESAKYALLNRRWHGNVRELRHTIERACIMCKNSIIRKQDVLNNSTTSVRTTSASDTPLKEYMEMLEKEKIETVFFHNNGNMTDTARHLNICRKSLWEKMRKHNIEK